MSNIANRPITQDELDVLISLVNMDISAAGEGVAKIGATEFGNVAFGGGGSAPVGTLGYGLVAPSSDFLKCDGAPLSQSTYSSLFAKVGINPKYNGVQKTILHTSPLTIAYSSSLGKYISVSSNLVSISSDGINWDVISPFHQQGSSMLDVVWSSGIAKFLITTSQNFVYTSTDGINWIFSQVDSTAIVTRAMASSTTFVVGGADNTDASVENVYTSTDGISWTRRNLATASKTITAMHYSAGLSLYFCGMSDGSIQSSSNATTWNARTSNIASQINAFDSFGSLIVAVGNAGVISSSADGTTWTSRTQQTSTALTGVAYSSTATIPWVAVGSGIVMTSTNGTTWYVLQSVYAGTRNIVWSSVDSKYATVGNTAMSATSTDLDTWTAGPMSSAEYTVTWNSMAYGNSAYVAVGSSGKIDSSADGVTWTNRTSNAGSSTLNEVIWDSTNSLFIVCGSGSILNTSPDGTTWTARTAAGGNNNSIATNGSGVSVLVCGNGSIFSSSNGTVWTSRTAVSGGLSSVTWDGTYFVATGANGIVIRSSDGTTWSKLSPIGVNNQSIVSLTSDGSSIFGIASTGGIGYVMISTDSGANWSAYGTPTAFSSIRWMNSKLIAYSVGCDLFYSTDGKSWTKSASNRNPTTFNKVYWFSGLSKFLVTCTSGIGTSTNGKVWKATYGSSQFADIAYSASQTRHVIAGQQGLIATSTDSGDTWTWVYDFTQGTSASAQPAGISYSSSLDLFVIVGNNGIIYSSANGTTWTQRSWTFPPHAMGNLGYGYLNDIDWSPSLGMFVAVGSGGAIVTSTNGTTWTNRTSPFFANWQQVAWNESLDIFVAVGNTGAIATSTDGITWTLRQSNVNSPITSVISLEANGFVAALVNQVLYSSDGLTWYTMSSYNVTISGKGFYSSVDGGAFIPSITSGTIYFTRDGKTLDPVAGISSANATNVYTSSVYDSSADKIIGIGSAGFVMIASRSYTKATQFIVPPMTNTWIKYQ